MKKTKICTFEYVPILYEKLRYGLSKFDFYLVANRTKRFKSENIQPHTQQQNCRCPFFSPR